MNDISPDDLVRKLIADNQSQIVAEATQDLFNGEGSFIERYKNLISTLRKHEVEVTAQDGIVSILNEIYKATDDWSGADKSTGNGAGEGSTGDGAGEEKQVTKGNKRSVGG